MSTFKDFLNEKEVFSSDMGQIKNMSMNIGKESAKLLSKIKGKTENQIDPKELADDVLKVAKTIDSLLAYSKKQYDRIAELSNSLHTSGYYEFSLKDTIRALEELSKSHN